MNKNVKINSPRYQQKQILPIFGGLGIIEIMIIMAFSMFSLILLLIYLIEAINIIVLLSSIFVLLLLSLYLISTNQRNNLKGWENIINFIVSLFTKKIVSSKKVYKDTLGKNGMEIESDFVKVNDKFLFGYYISGKNLNSISKFERERTINSFNKVLNLTDEEFSIFKIHEELGVNSSIQNYEDANKETDNKEIIKSNKEIIEKLEQIDKIISRYIIVYSFNSLEEAKSKSKDLDSKLINEIKFVNSKIESEELKEVLDYIGTFDTKINVKNNEIKIDKEEYISFEYISNYEPLLNTGWLSRLFNSNEYEVFMNISQSKTAPLLSELNKEVKRNNNFINESSNKMEIEKRTLINDLLHIEEDWLNKNKSQAKEFSVIVKLEATKHSELKHLREKLNEELKKDGIKLSNLAYRQYEAIKHIFPSATSNIKSIVQNEVTTKFISSSWPFMKNSLYDNKGLIIGDLNSKEEVNMVDIKAIDNSRINSNMFVLASSGAGKTVTTSTFINESIKSGDTVFIIDPENEYNRICEYYGGKVIDFSGEEGKINPLQVIKDNEGESIKEHLVFLDSFFKNLFIDIDNLQLAKFKGYIATSYDNAKITEKKIESSYEKIKWPTFTDIKKIYESSYKKEDASIKQQMIELGTYIDELATGSYSKLWNSQTNLDFNFNIIVFNINKYVENTRVTSSLMNLISKIVWGEVNRVYEENKTSKVKKWTSLIIDEAHLLMNKNNINSLEWISQVTKRIRKRNGSVFIITQNMSDFIGDADIKHISTKIINNCSYSLIGSLKPNDLKELEEMYESFGGMSKYEKEFIKNATAFQFVLTAGQDKKLYLKNTRPNIINEEPLGWEN